MKIYLYICLVLYLLSPVYSQTHYQCNVNLGVNKCNTLNKKQSTCPTISTCMSWVNQIYGLTTQDTVGISLQPGLNKYCLGNVMIPNVQSLSFYSIGQTAIFDCENQSFMRFSTKYQTNITFSNIKVIGNQDYQDTFGGGIFASYSLYSNYPTMTFYQCEFSNYSTSVAGGFLFSMGYNINIESSSFVNCSSVTGGAIASYGSVQLNIQSTSFWNNNGTDGGAIFVSGSNLQVLYSEFTNNNATASGAAIYNIGGILNIESTTFTNNNVLEGQGGAIFSERSPATIDKSNFVFNKASTDGGAVYGDNLLITSSNFVGNSATSGGSIYCTGPLSMLGSNIDSSNAYYGGAIYAAESLQMQSTEVLKSNSTYGGAIYLDMGLTFANIYDSLIYQSSAVIGGAIFAYPYASINLLGTSVQANIASQSAGGIFFADEYPQNFITGGLFVQNMCADSPSELTFNTDIMPASVRSVYVDNSYFSSSYITPIVDDNTSFYLRAYGVSGQDCINGFATLNNVGAVTKCSCFTGFSGPSCI